MYQTISLLSLATMAFGPQVSHAAHIDSIAATEDRLVLTVSGIDRPTEIVEMAACDERGDGGLAGWAHEDGDGATEIDRFDGERDRLYSKFVLVDRATGEWLCSPTFATDLSALDAWDNEIPFPESIKGVTCPVDIPDLIELGVDYVDFGVLLSALLDWKNEDPEEYWVIDGVKVGINEGYVEALDAQIKPLTEAGINVTLIPVNSIPGQPEPDCPLIHPMSDLAGAPNHLGAFNATDRRGLLYLRAAFEYMANRWSDPSAEHGTVSAYIVGNELQSHWYWNNQGDATLEQVVDNYAIALRMAWLAIRKTHENVRVYTSLDHCWTHPVDPDPGHATRGDLFLERLNDQVRAGGNFPWNLGFHPYPENLFEPRFWLDNMAVMGFDTPKITFKNLEVLPAYLRQPRFLFEGKPRRIMLSEQGFHAPDGPDGEEVQAAAYAYAYYKTSHMPEIDAFVLHRHVDHRGEAGLHLGLWTADPDGPTGSTPLKKRLIWDVFRLADTDQWEDAFAFALPIIGLKSWDEALPYQGPIPAHSGLVAEPIPEHRLVYDLIAHMSEPQMDKGLGWRTEFHFGPDGKLYPTLFQHPSNAGEPLSEAAYSIALPDAEKLTLVFGTAVVNDQGNGVGFRVAIEGETVFSVDQDAGTSGQHEVDVTKYAGQTIEVTLITDCLGDAGYDWAHWLRPVIVRE